MCVHLARLVAAGYCALYLCAGWYGTALVAAVGLYALCHLPSSPPPPPPGRLCPA